MEPSDFVDMVREELAALPPIAVGKAECIHAAILRACDRFDEKQKAYIESLSASQN